MNLRTQHGLDFNGARNEIAERNAIIPAAIAMAQSG